MRTRAEERVLLIALGLIGLAPGVAPARDSLRLPLTILENNPVTSIEVGGQEIQIGVDTGGGALGLTREVLARAGAVELADAPATWTDASGRTHEARRFRVPEIRVDGRSFTDMEAIEARPSPEGPAVANVIGREFLRNFIVIVDYAGRSMILLEAETPAPLAERMGCNGTRVPLLKTSEPGLPITQARLDGTTLRLLWDTGATYSALSARIVAARQLPVTAADGSKPPFFHPKRVILGSSNLGPLEFAVLPLELPAEFDGLLGYNVFTAHRVCLNYARGELRIR